jgi:cardiolipin synthase
MSFEADGAGTRLAEALLASPAPDRRLVIDSYARFTVNDRFLFWPPHLLDRTLQAEAAATRRLVRDLDRRGVRVRFVRPYGPLFARFAGRDHKKIVTVDDRVAYVGGNNFSDHNFAWDDLMLRIEQPAAARLLGDDVRATWTDRSVPRAERCGPLAIHLLDGHDNEGGFEALRALLRGARRHVVVQGPYVTFPVTQWLDETARRGVEVTVLTPAHNNRPLVQHHVLWELGRSACRVRLTTDGMSHVRAMVVDDEVAVLGSSSFSYLSYRCQGEVLAFVTDPALVAEVGRRVVRPALARSVPYQPARAPLRRRAGDRLVRVLGTIAVHLARLPRLRRPRA